MTRTLRLARDSISPIESHLEELSARSGITLFVLVLSAIFWWWNADAVISWYLDYLVPCEAELCMRVFDPGEWITSRWLLILLLSLLMTMPVLSWQIVTFSSPGLLPRERSWMKRLLILVPIFGGLTIVLTLLYGLPALFSWGHELNVSEGLTTRYDASELLRVAFTIAWVEGLLIVAICAVLVGGTSGLITKHTALWWRIRVHGFTLGIMWLILPESLAGVRISLLAFSALCIELSMMPFVNVDGFRMSLKSGRGILDHEGALRRVCFVDCRCAGASLSMSGCTFPSGTAAQTASGLCISGEERDALLEKVRDERFTDLIISGCDGRPLPFQFRDSLDILGINLSGLNLMNVHNFRTQSTHFSTLDMDLTIASTVDPWTRSSIRRRQLSTLERNKLPAKMIFCEKSGRLPWGTQLQSDEIFLPGAGPLGPELVSFAEDNQIIIINLDD